MTSSKGHIIVGLDIGTTKVCCLIGRVSASGATDVIGIGVAANSGVRSGVVVNIDSTTEAIRKAREEAELMSGFGIKDVWLSVSGSHLQSFDSKGMVAVPGKDIQAEDIQRVIDAAKAVAVPSDREVLHVLPSGYSVDDQSGIWDPIGMSGVRLDAKVHIVTASKTSLANLLKCMDRAGLAVKGLVLGQLASSMSVVSDDEKKLGVAVVDMGGGTCDTVLYVNGSVAHTSTLPIGGLHFTNDIAVGLRTPQNSAEDIKRKYGCALTSLMADDDTLEVEGVGGRKPRTVLRRHLAEIIEPRAEETLNLIHADLHASGLIELLGSGVVLTGGASQLDGLVEMGDFIFDVPVRKGLPTGVGGLTDVIKSASFATSVGLIRYGEKSIDSSKDQEESSLGSVLTTATRRLRELFGGE